MTVCSNAPRLFVAILLGTMLPVTGLVAQRSEPLTAARVRAFAKEAESRAKDDPTELVLALDKRVRDTWGNFESFPISILRREDIAITLTTPFMGYRRTLVEHLRMRRPVADVPWIDAAVVSVGINKVGAPDIVEIVVERDGKRVTAIKNGLRSMTFQGGNGQSFLAHQGDVFFPVSAFAPGGTVVVSAVPATGDRFTVTLESSQLQELK